MILVTGAVTARPDSFEALLEASLAHVRRSRTEAGCLAHAVHVDAEDPLRLVFVERWADADALLTHFRQPGSAEFMGQVRELAASTEPLETHRMEPVKLG